MDGNALLYLAWSIIGGMLSGVLFALLAIAWIYRVPKQFVYRWFMAVYIDLGIVVLAIALCLFRVIESESSTVGLLWLACGVLAVTCHWLACYIIAILTIKPKLEDGKTIGDAP
jgi:hypothetical protein